MTHIQTVLSKTQLTTLQTDMAQLGRQRGVRFIVLADFSGQDISAWDAAGSSDTATISALAAGDLLATLELGRMLGGRRACNLVVQEHDDQTVLIARVGQGFLLLLATAKDVPLGWSRLAIKRLADRIELVVGAAANTPPPAAITEDFEQQFQNQLNRIW
jgi:predicted regulator of Ras-like GTPase activity (Roadblock/LC7/MglB family)